MIKLTDIHELILALCVQDHVGLWFTLGEVENELRISEPVEVRKRTLEILHDLLKAGLIQAGFPTPDGRGFDPWILSADETIKRINREWKELGREPSIADIVWFTTTENGDKEMERLIAGNKWKKVKRGRFSFLRKVECSPKASKEASNN